MISAALEARLKAISAEDRQTIADVIAASIYDRVKHTQWRSAIASPSGHAIVGVTEALLGEILDPDCLLPTWNGIFERTLSNLPPGTLH